MHSGSRSCCRISTPSLFTFGIGYRTRLSNAVVLLLNSYLYWRNVYVVSGAEDLARLLLIWCLFLPLNRYWSVDAALDPQSRERPYPVLPFVALRLQIVSLYVFSGLFKLAGARWLDGSAVAMVLTDNMFGATPVGLFLAGHFPGLLVFVTYATIAFQLALPFLVYSPWYNDLTRAIALARWPQCMPPSSSASTSAPFPSSRWQRSSCWSPIPGGSAAAPARASAGPSFEPGCGFCERISLLLREFLLAPSAKVMPASARSRSAAAADRAHHGPCRVRATTFTSNGRRWSISCGEPLAGAARLADRPAVAADRDGAPLRRDRSPAPALERLRAACYRSGLSRRSVRPRKSCAGR